MTYIILILSAWPFSDFAVIFLAQYSSQSEQFNRRKIEHDTLAELEVLGSKLILKIGTLIPSVFKNKK